MKMKRVNSISIFSIDYSILFLDSIVPIVQSENAKTQTKIINQLLSCIIVNSIP